MANYTSLGTGNDAGYSYGAPDHGFLAMSLSPEIAITNTVQATAGLVRLQRLRLPSAASVTNIVMYCQTGGATLTAGQCFAALHTSAGVKIGVTADQAASWVSSGLKTMALAGGPYSQGAADYYVSFWFNGTTGPTWSSSSTASALYNSGRSAPNFLSATADTSITTTAPDPFGTQTGSGVAWWVALS